MESELTDALATSARAMPRLRSGPHHLHRKDVPHLSESLLIGIERWRFVEGSVNEFARLMNRSFVLDRQRLLARDTRHVRSCFVPPAAFCARQSLASARSAISPTSGESEGAAATRRKAACARVRRAGSSMRQLLRADNSRAAT